MPNAVTMAPVFAAGAKAFSSTADAVGKTVVAVGEKTFVDGDPVGAVSAFGHGVIKVGEAGVRGSVHIAKTGVNTVDDVAKFAEKQLSLCERRK